MKNKLLVLAFSLLFVVTASSQNATLPTSLPTSEQILEKYIQAIGGRQAHEKLTSRVSIGEWVNKTRGTRMPIKIYAQAPNLRVEVLDTRENHGFTGRGFDGKQGWSMNMLETGLRQITGEELSMMERESDFYRQVKLDHLYQRLSVIKKEKINSHEVYTLEAIPEVGNPEKLYFDIETGLLIRRDMIYANSKVPVQHYYENYKEVDGIKLPFTIRSEGPVIIITEFKEVKHNVSIEQNKFKSPTSN